MTPLPRFTPDGTADTIVDDAHSPFAELGFDPVAADVSNHRASALRNQCNACSGVRKQTDEAI